MASQQERTCGNTSSAPESGTNRDDTSGNNPSGGAEGRGQTDAGKNKRGPDQSPKGDDPSNAGEER